MQTRQIEIAPFSPDHLEAAVALSRQAGWPHRPEDWQMALALSEGMVAIEDDRVVGTVLVTPYKDDCATINMVIVDETMRGRGLGRSLMDAALRIAGDRPLRLVATTAGLPLYQKLGFHECGTVLQHQGFAGGIGARLARKPPPWVISTPSWRSTALPSVPTAKGCSPILQGSRIRRYSPRRRRFGIRMPAFLRSRRGDRTGGRRGHRGRQETHRASHRRSARKVPQGGYDCRNRTVPMAGHTGARPCRRWHRYENIIGRDVAARTATTFALASQALG